MMPEEKSKYVSDTWEEIIQFARFPKDGGKPKNVALLRHKQNGQILLSASQGQNRVAVLLSKGELAQLAFILMREAMGL